MALKRFLKKVEPSSDSHHREFEDSEDARPADDEGGWLVSYADMMTLLCGFFIMLFSMAHLDEPQFEKVKESVSKQFGGDYKSPNQDLAKFVTNVLQEAGIEKEATVKFDSYGVSVVFESTLFFDTLNADVRPQGQTILNHLIDSVGTRQDVELKKYNIVVEGHTDSRPITNGVFPSNWELSSARAARVVRMFLNKGFPPDHLVAIGYADTHPQVDARGPNGAWDEKLLAKNRRVVVRILDPKNSAIPRPEVLPAETAAAGEPGAVPALGPAGVPATTAH